MKHTLKKFFKNKSFINIYIFVLLPTLILIGSECISMIFNHQSYKKLLTQNYEYKLETLHNENMSLLQNITSFAYSLSGNENFMEYLYNTEPVPIEDIRLKNQVRLLSESHQFIDSIAIIKRVGDGFVFVNDRIVSMQEYFTSEYEYEAYPTEYWSNYQSPIQGVKFLSPTKVHCHDQEKFVYPVVYSKIGSKSLDPTLLVINIDMVKMAQSVNQKLTNNTKVLFINNADESVYDVQDSTVFKMDDALKKQIYKQSSGTFYYTTKGTRYYVVSAYHKNSPFGYSYATILPSSDLTKVHTTVSIISILLILISLIIAFLSSKKLFNPWQLLATRLDLRSSIKDGSHDIDNIFSSVDTLINDNSSMSEKYSKYLPLAQERYLVNILNSQDYSSVEQADLVNFEYDYFCSIIMRLRPTEHFSELYTDEEYVNIRSGVYNIMKSMFGGIFDSFVIPSENHSLYILLNLPDDSQGDRILEIINDFNKLLEPDKKYISLHVGIGSILSGIAGMKFSHNEAMNAISAIPGINSAYISNNTENEQISETVRMILDINDESSIYNNLVTGNINKAREHILKLFEKNKATLSNKRTLTQFYMQIFNVIFKAMKTKNISYGENGADDLDTMLSILSNTSLEIHETMLSMLSQLETVILPQNSKSNINEILGYINEHFAEDIYLDSLSEQFGISSSYLSKLIKEQCGMNFISYLSSLRIEKAKELLLHSKLTVTDIYMQTGFNNRTTFIRTFKKATGLSPSDFRKLQS